MSPHDDMNDPDELRQIVLKLQEQAIELQYKANWLERRYAQMSTAIADTIRDTLPLELQQKFYLVLSKRLDTIKNADVTRKN